jgi:glycine/D-amino acid oxidase-like deaminating enzyme/nitrite reductase/ring-hydroxylating ferredoxin subunit
MNTTSFWTDSTSLPRFAKLKQNCEVDVVVIGAGITGVTAAHLLKRAGRTVALIERGRCGGFDTINTTAHLTCVTDMRLHKLVKLFGKDRAKATWEAGRAAIDQVVTNIRNESIDCEFEWVPGYLHAPPSTGLLEERSVLEQEAQLATELGFPAEFVAAVPWLALPGIRFEQQAKFHPCKYLAALLRAIPGDGSNVFEHTEAGDIEAQPLAVTAGDHKIRCRYVVLATHTPLMGKTNAMSAALFQTKLFLYTTYAVGAQVPKDRVPEACFWDTATPYRYLRVDKRRGFDYAIFGGEDHKTGQVGDTTEVYRRLEEDLGRIMPGAKVDHRWSGQVIETPDGLPYIGETASQQFAATGFGGNGMTFGTLGAMMAVDAFLARKNPWADLFQVHRTKIRGGTWDYLKENKDYPYYLLRDWLGGAEGKSLRTVKRNQGKILNLDGRKVAAYRDPQGKVTLCSPVCTHLKCIVAWNDAESTWDCPCHGSRFSATGEVMAGPAEKPLEKILDPPASQPLA